MPNIGKGQNTGMMSLQSIGALDQQVSSHCYLLLLVTMFSGAAISGSKVQQKRGQHIAAP